MAIVLQGIQSPTDKKYIGNFLYIMYPNPTPIETKLGAWRQNAGNFVGKSRKLTINKALLSISKDTEMDVFRTGDWVNFKDSSGEAIFRDANNNSIFIDGERDAIQKMKQIAEFLIDGTQITSGGGFSLMVDTYSLLKANKQLILNGAPGTGKTFSARNEIADKLLGENADKNIQMEMMQFHPSYDYTDFIEGIRPNLASRSIGYTLKNGSFKSFCRKAGVIERIQASGKKVTEDTIKEFLSGEDKSIVDFWINKIKEEGFDAENIKPAELPPFLFIIDEINRAEISKVLGETMFCLDADYRGEKGRIATQYSALATDETFYINKDNDKFFIPSNVYIIGTMNDIDRSVEVFDFALRRRFAWHEVTAEAVMDKVTL